MFEIHSSSYPDELTGKDVMPEHVVTVARGPNIAYSAIPFEMLRTIHTAPQITAVIDGMEAICTGMACDYVHVAPEGEVTGMSVGGLTGHDVTIMGTNLPLELLSITIGGIDCVVTTNTEGAILCEMSGDWIAGTHLPAVRDANGLIPVSDSC
jgi:hypothetical protein